LTVYQTPCVWLISACPCRDEAAAQIFFQPGEGGFDGVVVLPVGEIGDVMFANFFRQIFTGSPRRNKVKADVRVLALPFLNVAQSVNGMGEIVAG
jgi:hypothetical protein